MVERVEDGAWIKTYTLCTGTIQTQFDTTSPKIFNTEDGFIQLLGATENGVSITPSSVLLDFEPETLVIPPGGSIAAFSYTGTLLGNDVVSWSITGIDAALYDIPPTSTINVGKSMFAIAKR